MDVINHSVHCQCWKCKEAKSSVRPDNGWVPNPNVKFNPLIHGTYDEILEIMQYRSPWWKFWE